MFGRIWPFWVCSQHDEERKKKGFNELGEK